MIRQQDRHAHHLAAVGSEITADDQIIDIEGYEYSKDLTTEKNGGESVTGSG